MTDAAAPIKHIGAKSLPVGCQIPTHAEDKRCGRFALSQNPFGGQCDAMRNGWGICHLAGQVATPRLHLTGALQQSSAGAPTQVS